MSGYPEKTAARVVVVDAHPLTRWGLCELIGQQPDIEVLGEAGSAAEATSRVAALRPDVVSIGISLPDGNGLDLARALRDRYQSLGIVILTSLGEDDVLFRALETGVSAFVSKQAPVVEILGAIRHASVASSSFSASGLADALRRRTKLQATCMLSPRERQVLGLLTEGMSVPAIAASLYLSTSTAKTYVARLYEKLGAGNRSQALMTAVSLGLAGTAARV
jgi:DNA-binding NarL/FixJ family response regulator